MLDELTLAVTEGEPTLEEWKAIYRSISYKGMGEYTSILAPKWCGDSEEVDYLCRLITSIVCAE